MSLSNETATKIKTLLLNTVRDKLRTYKPETAFMPFHYRLLGKDRYIMFSFIQSVNTTFDMSIWEQVAVLLATSSGRYAERQYKLLGEIDTDTEKFINELHYKLRKGEIKTNKNGEVEEIRRRIRTGNNKEDPDSTVDFFMKINNSENYFDITSAKPNMKEFVALKLKLLRWVGLRLSQNKNVELFTRLAIPLILITLNHMRDGRCKGCMI
jgi:hypothetical protein